MELSPGVTQPVSLRGRSILDCQNKPEFVKLEVRVLYVSQTNSLRYTRSLAQRKPDVIQRSCAWKKLR